MKSKTQNPLTGHEEFCLANAISFSGVRGRTPARRERFDAPELAAVEAYAAQFGDGKTMIYAITAEGRSAHIKNA